MILSNVPPSEWPTLRLKVAAAEELMGKRKDWGQSRSPWRGSYLSGVSISLSASYWWPTIIHNIVTLFVNYVASLSIIISLFDTGWQLHSDS